MDASSFTFGVMSLRFYLKPLVSMCDGDEGQKQIVVVVESDAERKHEQPQPEQQPPSAESAPPSETWIERLVGSSCDPCGADFDLLHRNRRLNCTEVAAVLHQDPWLSRVRVFKRKTSGRRQLTGKPPPTTAARWGVAHEAEAIAAYEKHFGTKVQRCGFVTHPEHGWIGGVPDGLVNDAHGNRRLLEVKCPTVPSEHPVDAPPPWYYCQIQTLMQCCDVRCCDYVEFRPNESDPERRLVTVTVSRDDGWFESILMTLRRFWDDVVEHKQNRIVVID